MTSGVATLCSAWIVIVTVVICVIISVTDTTVVDKLVSACSCLHVARINCTQVVIVAVLIAGATSLNWRVDTLMSVATIHCTCVSIVTFVVRFIAAVGNVGA